MNNENGIVFVCPCCGKVKILFDNHISCEICHHQMIETQYDNDYWTQLLFTVVDGVVDGSKTEELEKELQNKYCVNSQMFDQRMWNLRKSKENIEDELTPKCPTCGSTDIHKISGVNKVAKGALFGIFAIGKISKTFHCDNCNYEW